jgi:hypothetical protein
MGGNATATGFFFLAILLSGVVTGALAAVAVAVHREERRYSLSGAAPGVLARAVRRVTGVRDARSHFVPRGWA